MTGYGALTDYWSSHGFVVIAPTHLDSHTLNLAPEDPRTPTIWRSRIADLRSTIDQMPTILAAVPGLAERTDPNKLAIAGHSWGATSASALLGATVLDASGRPESPVRPDPRIRAAVLLCLAGTGGENLTPFAAEHYASMSPGFETMVTPALLVRGDHDQSMLSTRGPDWWADGYHLSPGPKSLLTLFGAEHSLGGITSYGVAETTDENLERVAVLQRLTTAYLETALGVDADAWNAAHTGVREFGTLESK
jgi:pimeloyl-ACP methyl ester carboxylesterase